MKWVKKKYRKIIIKFLKKNSQNVIGCLYKNF